MPTREQVWNAATALRRGGERVNQKNVLSILRAEGIGATQRTIAEDLIAWKASEAYGPRHKPGDLPRHLADLHTGFVARIWEAAMAEATARLDARRAEIEREREAAGQLLDETQIRAEETGRQNEALQARQAEMDVEIAALRSEVAHLRRTAFWDTVVREVVELLPADEWMTAQEIARCLPPSLKQEALTMDKALTPGRLHKQMRLRDHHGRFFELDEEGPRYRRRPGWTGITQLPEARRGADRKPPRDTAS